MTRFGCLLQRRRFHGSLSAAGHVFDITNLQRLVYRVDTLIPLRKESIDLRLCPRLQCTLSAFTALSFEAAYAALLVILRLFCSSRTCPLHFFGPFAEAIRTSKCGEVQFQSLPRPAFWALPLRLKMYTGNHHEYTYVSLDGSSTAFQGYAPQAPSPPIYPYQAQRQASPTPHQYHHLQTNMSISTSVPQLSSTSQQSDEMTIDHLLDNVCRLLVHLTFPDHAS